jgi:hypothetical protein
MWYAVLCSRCTQLSYHRSELPDSDHKPVTALYRLLPSAIDTDAQSATYAAAASKFERWSTGAGSTQPPAVPAFLVTYSDRFTRAEREKIRALMIAESDRNVTGTDVVLEGMGAMGTGMIGAATYG